MLHFFVVLVLSRACLWDGLGHLVSVGELKPARQHAGTRTLRPAQFPSESLVRPCCQSGQLHKLEF